MINFSFSCTSNCTGVNGREFLWSEKAIGTNSVLTSCESWIPATNKDALRPWSWSLDTTDLSTIEIEEPKSYIASTFRLKLLFVRLIRITGSPAWVILVATAVVASDTLAVASFLKRSLCKNPMCRFAQLGTLHVLLQSFDRWPGLKQLKYSRNFWTWSRCSVTFINLNFSQVGKGCCSPLEGHSRFLRLLESSAFEAKVLVLGLLRLRNFFLSNNEFVCTDNLL